MSIGHDMRRIAALFSLLAFVASRAAAAQTLPIIDMHMHAYPADA